MTGVKLDANKHCKLPFGAYVQTHEEHDNSMTTRTIGAIALRPTGNTQGGYYFLGLQKGKRINRNNWTEIPMPPDVMERVNKMAGSRRANRLAFANRTNVEVEEDTDEEVREAELSDSDSDNDLDESAQSMETETQDCVNIEQNDVSQEQPLLDKGTRSKDHDKCAEDKSNPSDLSKMTSHTEKVNGVEDSVMWTHLSLMCCRWNCHKPTNWTMT